MSKNTPTPWRVNLTQWSDGHTTLCIESAYGDIICRLPTKYGEPTEEEAANAKLIVRAVNEFITPSLSL